jgi:predicted nucleic acid-binding protein
MEGKDMPVEPKAVTEFIDENWEFFARFSNQADETLKKISRELPPQLYEELRDGLAKTVLAGRPNSRIQLRVVIDTNIVVMDAIRVAKGYESSTERILSSPFIEVLAPTEIRGEVTRVLGRKFREATQLETALNHARKLLSKVVIETAIPSSALDRARKLIGGHAPEDVPFLALAIGSRSTAVISRDRTAFDAQSVIKRWQLGKAVQLVVERESGAISLFLASESIIALGRALTWIAGALYRGLAEILAALVSIVGAIFEGTPEALGRIPSWAWVVLGIAAIGTLIAYVTHAGFREWLNKTVAEGVELVTAFLKSVETNLSTFFSFLNDLIVLTWNLVLPVGAAIFVCFGVLAGRIAGLLKSIDEDVQAAGA